MPTYEYRCPTGHDFDHFFRKISEGEATWPCPVCGLPAERQMSGGAGLVFKGSGFYITDYGKDGKKDQRTAGASDAATPAAAPSGASGNAPGNVTGNAPGNAEGGSAAPSGHNSTPTDKPSSAARSKSTGDAPKPSGGTKQSGTTKPE
jgi:putative FmdB family regulatory protein